MSVRVTGTGACMAELKEIERFMESPNPMTGIVEDIKASVLEKTSAGHDYRGRNFEAYSDAYKDKRKKKGLTTKPDLKVTGTMLNAITTKVVNPRHGQVFVAPDSEGRINADMLANIHNTGTGKQPKREFMNVTPNAVQVLTKKHYDDPILEIVRKYR